MNLLSARVILGFLAVALGSLVLLFWTNWRSGVVAHGNLSVGAPTATPVASANTEVARAVNQLQGALADDLRSRIQGYFGVRWMNWVVWAGPGTVYANRDFEQVQRDTPVSEKQAASVRQRIATLDVKVRAIGIPERVRFSAGEAETWPITVESSLPADFAEPADPGMSAKVIYRIFKDHFGTWRFSYLDGEIVDSKTSVKFQ
jgi:hypothetical protein